MAEKLKVIGPRKSTSVVTEPHSDWLELLSSWQSLSIYKIAKQMCHKCCQYVALFDSSVCTRSV